MASGQVAEHTGAPTNAASVKKVLANSEPMGVKRTRPPPNGAAALTPREHSPGTLL